MSYDNTNSGVLFNAADRKENETDRDYSGNIEIKCPHCQQNSEHWLSGWINKMKRDNTLYLKIKSNPKGEQAPPSAGNVLNSGGYTRNSDGTVRPPSHIIDGEEFKDDIPF